MRSEFVNQTRLAITFFGLIAAVTMSNVGCRTGETNVESTASASPVEPTEMNPNPDPPAAMKTELATFGAGCFWCVEAVFQQLDGVIKVESGYTGGHLDNPTYDDVCEGNTGHAEVCQITYDPTKITFDELLEVFWKTHDPTTLNRQGNDVGTQYRSAVFYHTNQQRELAEKYKRELNAAQAFDAPIVTEITAAAKFYKAENYHQSYYQENASAPYCQMIIRPKVDKVRKVFGSKVKTGQ